MRSLYDRLRGSNLWAPVKVALIYLLISFLWIILSDRLLLGSGLNLSDDLTEMISIFKGWLFVVVSAVIIFQLIRNEMKKRQGIEKEIVDSERRFRAVFDNAGLGIIIIDRAGRIMEANPVAAQMVGYSRDELKGMSMFSLTPVEDVTREEMMFRGSMKPNQPVSYKMEKRYLRKDGSTFSGSLIASLIRDESGKPIYGVEVIEDITKLKEIDAAKTEFVTLASHQLRTPLTIVSWYAEALLSGSAGELTGKQRHYFDNIVVANKRMIRLVSDLLNTSRIDTGRFVINSEPVNVADIAESEIESLRPKIENRLIHVEKVFGGNLEKVMTDHNLLRVVFQNLLSNAVKYSRPGGQVRLTIVADAEQLDIEVSDQGFGIPQVYSKQMFKKFYRADNIREIEPDGTGLGLYMVKSLVDQVGGEIWYESEEGQGSTFHVVIPVNVQLKADNK